MSATSTYRATPTRGRVEASPLFVSTTSATARMPWTPWTDTSWTAGNCASRWPATAGRPIRTASHRLGTEARAVDRAPAPAAGGAGRGAAGGPGHVAARGAVPARAVTAPVRGPGGREAAQRTVDVPVADPGGAGAGGRAAVAAGAEAGTRAEAARGAVSPRKVDRSPGVTVEADPGTAAAPSQRTAAEAGTGASRRSAAEASIAAGRSRRSAAEASTAASPSRGSAAGARIASPGAAGASNGADPSPRNAAEARDAASPSRTSAVKASIAADPSQTNGPGAVLTAAVAVAGRRVSHETTAAVRRQTEILACGVRRAVRVTRMLVRVHGRSPVVRGRITARLRLSPRKGLARSRKAGIARALNRRTPTETREKACWMFACIFFFRHCSKRKCRKIVSLRHFHWHPTAHN